ncbi:hypothetical protein [Nocardia sp. NPDC006630]|uniref:hypothetical protein n=1 Tax=Nocardia sp. NPDC006630 TaxID=3157181 RepID=UPI0033A1CF72
MARWGFWLMVLGFGSLLLRRENREFLVLAWADPIQPVFGVVLGLIGVGVLLAGALWDARLNAAAERNKAIVAAAGQWRVQAAAARARGEKV